VIHPFVPAAKRKVAKVLSDHEVEEVDYEHAPNAGVRCNNLQRRFHWRIVYDSDPALERSFPRGDCGRTLQPPVKDISQYWCRQSGARSLTQGRSTLYDSAGGSLQPRLWPNKCRPQVIIASCSWRTEHQWSCKQHVAFFLATESRLLKISTTVSV
jgi:hypothetical protein